MPNFVQISWTLWPCIRNKETDTQTDTHTFGFSGRELAFTFAICYRPSVCRLSVCLSVVCNVGAPYSAGWNFRQFFSSPYDSSGSLVFWYQKSLVGDAPFPLRFAFKVTQPFQTAKFRPISAHSASAVIASEKSSISTYRKSTTRFPTSHRSTVYVTPKSPKGWHNNAISLFVPVKFNFSRKKSATKLLCMKTSGGKVVATSFPYPTVHRSVAGTSPSTWNWRSKWRTPSENADFQSFRLVALQQ